MPPSDSLAIRVLLIALVAFGPMSVDLYLPSLPLLARVFETEAATVQLTLSVFLAGFAVAQLVYGPASDRFGRRPALLGGIALFIVGSVGCALATSIEALIAARFAQALGACGGPVVARAVVRDLFGRDKAATVFAYMAMAMALAPAVGPMLGGLLTESLGWRANFVFLVLFGAAAYLATSALLGETNVHPDADALRPSRLVGNYARLLGDRAYLAHALAGSFSYCGIFAFISGSSFVLIDTLKLGPAVYGMSFGSVAVGYMAGSFVAGRLSGRLGTDRMIRLGTAVSLVGGLVGAGLAGAGVLHVVAILAPMVLFMVGAGMTMPNAMAGAVGPYPRMAGSASALLGFAQMTIAAGLGVVVGHLSSGTALPMMGAVAAAALAARASYALKPSPVSAIG